MTVFNHKVLTSALLALVFSVAVSGGCGGGGGHYSGNYGDSSDSSQEVTIENVSTDVVPPEPDEPALSDQFASENGDDEYGDGEISSFVLLNKTTWKIDNIEISTKNQKSCDVQEGNSHNADTITFLILPETTDLTASTDQTEQTDIVDSMKIMTWATKNAKKTPIYKDLTVQFKDPSYKSWQTAPILKPNDRFYGTGDSYYTNFTENNLATIETIYITETFNDIPSVAKKILVKNQFMTLRNTYTSDLYLSRVDNFSILDQTDWQIKKVRVVGLIKSGNGYVCGNPNNYPVDNFVYTNDKITLLTNSDNQVGSFNYMLNDEHTDTLTLSFQDNTLLKNFKATILKPAGGFNSQGKQNNGYEVFEAKTQSQVLPLNLRIKTEHLDREQLYVSDYGPNGYVSVYNSFYVKDNDSSGRTVYRFYWAILDLEPYNPNKK